MPILVFRGISVLITVSGTTSPIRQKLLQLCKPSISAGMWIWPKTGKLALTQVWTFKKWKSHLHKLISSAICTVSKCRSTWSRLVTGRVTASLSGPQLRCCRIWNWPSSKASTIINIIDYVYYRNISRHSSNRLMFFFPNFNIVFLISWTGFSRYRCPPPFE